MTTGNLARSLSLLAVVTSACGGDGGTPTTPSPPGGGAAALTIAIVATSGPQSFSPNPATRTQGGGVAFRNADGVVHRIVANDGSFDTGDLTPGATSRAIDVAAAGTNYHCSLHPAMVGAIGSTQGEPPPPCTGLYCD